jgi:7-cyano-7-deazaguanine synthase
VSDLLLLSGGVDSTALLAWKRPDAALFIDYGQLPADGERAAAEQVAQMVGVTFETVTVQSREIGAGLMSGSSNQSGALAPAEEWWPFRNQLIVTIAAAWGVTRGISSVLTGTVESDGARHSDGTRGFYRLLDQLVHEQEGELSVQTPAIGMTSVELVKKSGVSDSILAWTFSCHRSAIACGFCPGCVKRERVMAELGRLQ